MSSGGERSTNLDEKSKTIGNQIGGSKSETPTPVGRAGSLSGSAHTGSPIPIIAADYTNRANYQSQYAANNREAINQRKREWRKRTGKH